MKWPLRQKRHTMTVILSLITAQVCLTIMWLVYDGQARTNTRTSYMFRRTDLVQTPRVLHSNSTFQKANHNLPTQKSHNTTVRGGLEGGGVVRGNGTADKPHAGPPLWSVQRIQTSQSKWILQLSASAKVYCSGQVESYGDMTALLRRAVVDPAKGSAQAKGGETISKVLLQKEDREFYTLKRGFVALDNCPNPPPLGGLSFGPEEQQDSSLSKAITISQHAFPTAEIPDYEGDFVIVLTRYEYANVYWTVMDLYDTFLMMQLYNRTFQDTDLFLLDAHPNTPLDGLFQGTFRRVFRLTDLATKTRFPNLLPCFGRKDSPLLMKILRPLTMGGQFRTSVLSALKVRVGSQTERAQRCREKRLSILFIWRRNYVGHPRNPKGIVSRKIANEMELLNSTRSHFPNCSVRGVQLDRLPIVDQLALIGNADILVGMHGAAFGFTLFMQEGSGVLEMWPRHAVGNWHMEYLAKRSGLYYKLWQNDKESNENFKEKTTIVSIPEVNRKLTELSASVCSKHT